MYSVPTGFINEKKARQPSSNTSFNGYPRTGERRETQIEYVPSICRDSTPVSVFAVRNAKSSSARASAVPIFRRGVALVRCRYEKFARSNEQSKFAGHEKALTGMSSKNRVRIPSSLCAIHSVCPLGNCADRI